MSSSSCRELNKGVFLLNLLRNISYVERKSLQKHFLGMYIYIYFVFLNVVSAETFHGFKEVYAVFPNCSSYETAVYLLSLSHLLFLTEQQNIWDLERLGFLV